MNCVTQAKKIAEINDSLRQTFIGGKVLLTQGVIAALDVVGRGELMRRIKAYDSFDKSNDPYGEHDFGVIVMGGESYFWKIDYYALDMKWHSDDPANIEITNRVMTITRPILSFFAYAFLRPDFDEQLNGKPLEDGESLRPVRQKS